jgi:F0F1-type ATP synthase membrane subunit b/b'
MDLTEVVGMATAIVVALSGGMVMLWKNNHDTVQARINRAEEKLDACETNHKEANTALIKLSERVGNLEGMAKRIREVPSA